MTEDLVCGKQVKGEGNCYFTGYSDNLYYFCSPECKRMFDDHPDNYIKSHAKEKLGI